MYVDPGYIAVALGIAIAVIAYMLGRNSGVNAGVEGTLNMLSEQKLIRMVEHNGDVEILPGPAERE